MSRALPASIWDEVGNVAHFVPDDDGRPIFSFRRAACWPCRPLALRRSIVYNFCNSRALDITFAAGIVGHNDRFFDLIRIGHRAIDHRNGWQAKFQRDATAQMAADNISPRHDDRIDHPAGFDGSLQRSDIPRILLRQAPIDLFIGGMHLQYMRINVVHGKSVCRFRLYWFLHLTSFASRPFTYTRCMRILSASIIPFTLLLDVILQSISLFVNEAWG